MDKTLRMRWLNDLGCEMAHADCKDSGDVANQLILMLRTVGVDMKVGDYLTFDDVD